MCGNEIISTAYTKPNAGSMLAVKQALNGYGLKLQNLYDYVFYQHARAKAHPSSSTYFETVLLFFGARYDCGIGEDGKSFVNEITRLYSGDMFSAEVHGKPYTHTVIPYSNVLGDELAKQHCGHAKIDSSSHLQVRRDVFSSP